MDSSLQIARRVLVYLFRAIVLRRQKYINATEDINARKIYLRTLFYPIEKDFLLQIYFVDINFVTSIFILCITFR